jgi:hypothetical protein
MQDGLLSMLCSMHPAADAGSINLHLQKQRLYRYMHIRIAQSSHNTPVAARTAHHVHGNSCLTDNIDHQK